MLREPSRLELAPRPLQRARRRRPLTTARPMLSRIDDAAAAALPRAASKRSKTAADVEWGFHGGVSVDIAAAAAAGPTVRPKAYGAFAANGCGDGDAADGTAVTNKTGQRR